MPTIKIVPMPGVSVPGPQGPAGQPGPAGPAGPSGLFEAVRVETGAYIQQETTNMSFVVYPPLSSGWSIGQRVRLWHTDLQGLHVDGTIDYIAAEFRDSFSIVIDTYNLSGMDTLEYDMTLLTAGTGAVDSHGDFQFTAATANVNNSQSLRLESRRWDGTQASALILSPGDPSAVINATNMQGYPFSNQWSSATWSGEAVDILDATDIVDWLNQITGYSNIQRVIINQGTPINVTGLSWTPTNVQLAVAVPAEDVTQITDITFIYSTTSQIRVDYDNDAIDIIGNKMGINLTTTQGRDINVTSSDDLLIQTGDDTSIRSGGHINFVSSADNNNYEWRMESNGTLEFPARGRLRNPANSSGDGNGYDTFEIIPDFSRYEYDQYLIVDPTQPNHIHIRPGGTQDASLAELILGGEYTNVRVSDSGDNVVISTLGTDGPQITNNYTNINTSNGNFITYDSADIRVGGWVSIDSVDWVIAEVIPNTPSAGLITVVAGSGPGFEAGASYDFTYVTKYSKEWQFTNNGYLNLPSGNPVISNLAVPGDITIGAYNGVKLSFADVPGAGLKFPDDTVQTTAYPGPGALFPQSVNWTPEVSGTGFVQTSNQATGTYLKYGSMVVVNMLVPFTSVTDFGTGQYSVTLPFAAKQHADVFAGSIHNTGPTTDHYSLKGHLSAGNTIMTLWYISGSSKDEPFKHNAPITVNTTDLFHMHFIYEIQE